jgi:hypothetical protein
VIFSAAAKVMGRAGLNPARWLTLIGLFCATASCERAYAMNDLLNSSQPKFGQEVEPRWWSPTAPNGEEFELPSGTKICSRLKVRFVEQIIWVAARVGPGYPGEASFLVEDNFGDQQYPSGEITKASFYTGYNDVHLGQSEINRKMGQNDWWFQDRNDANLVLRFGVGDRPETNASYYVCAFKEGERVLLSYFLKRLPRFLWKHSGFD